MKKAAILLTAILCLSFAIPAFAQNVGYASPMLSVDTLSKNENISDNYVQAAADSSWWNRKIENKAFGLGEKLEFAVKYGIIPAGNATMEINEIVNYENHDSYNIKTIAHSNRVVSVFYKVRDTVQTYVDTDGIFPRKFRKKMKEGGV